MNPDDIITYKMIDTCAQRLVSWDGGSEDNPLVWPDSWYAGDVMDAKRDAEKVLRTFLVNYVREVYEEELYIIGEKV